MVVLHFLFFNIFSVVWRVNCSHTGEGELLLMDGRIALNGWANCNSPLRVCFLNVRKYHVNMYKYTKKDITGMVWILLRGS